MNKNTTLLLIRNFKGTKKKLCTNVYLYSCCIVYYVVSLTLAKISKCQLREEKKNIFLYYNRAKIIWKICKNIFDWIVEKIII